MSFEDAVRIALAADADRDRLPDGFAARVVRSLPRRGLQRRWLLPSRWPMAASVAALVVAAAVVASQSVFKPAGPVHPSPTDATSSVATASPEATAKPSTSATAEPRITPIATGIGDLDEDGVPRAIDGVPVLRDDAVTAHVAATADDTTFLIGGRVIRPSMRCPITDGVVVTGLPSLLPPCSGLEIGFTRLGGEKATAAWRQFAGSFVVVRVHVHDPRAAACAAAVRTLCEQTAIPDALVWVRPTSPTDTRADVVDALAGRYDDGLPRSIEGRPVLRGPDAIAFARTESAGSSFLIAGWITNAGLATACPIALPDSDWLHQCARPDVSDLAGAYDAPLMKALTLRFLLQDPATGPAVMEVHVGDPRASTCTPDPAVCAAMMVADRVVWSGDSTTDPRGLDEASVAAALRSVDPGLTMTALGHGVMPQDCSAPFPGAVGYNVAGDPSALPTVGFVGIAPTAEARLRVVPIDASAAATFAKTSRICTVTSGGASNPYPAEYVQRWLTYDNVALVVSTHQAPTAADRAYVERLLVALAQADSIP